LTVNTFVKDGQGGIAMLWGSGTTKPGGHYEKISNLQQGLKNDIAEYKRLCSNNGGWPPVPRTIDDSANRNVPAPVFPTPVDTPSPKIQTSDQSWSFAAADGAALALAAGALV
jgi:hypothetical protein